MAVLPTARSNPTRPNAKLNGADDFEIVKKEWSGIVQEAYRRTLKLSGMFDFETVSGTNTIVRDGVGTVTTSVITRNNVPEPEILPFSNRMLTVDNTLMSRANFFKFDLLQAKYEVRNKAAKEQGIALAYKQEEALGIKLALAAQAEHSPFYANGVELAGHAGGTVLTGTEAQLTDPDIFFNKLIDLIQQMATTRNVDPLTGGFRIVLHPTEYYLLMKAEKLVNHDYVTSDGATERGWVLSMYGIPVIQSGFVPRTVITDHDMNSDNANYDGDFTKLRALVFNQETLWCGKTADLEVEQWFDNFSKHWYVDSTLMIGIDVDRTETAGALFVE